MQIVYEHPQAGMVDAKAESPRTRSRFVDAGGGYGGPLVVCKNTDRRRTKWDPRGGEEAVNPQALGGTFEGMDVFGEIENDRSDLAAAENLLAVLNIGGTRFLGRLAPGAGTPTFQKMAQLAGAGDWRFLLLDEKHVLMYDRNGVRSALVAHLWNEWNDVGVDWTMGNNSTAVTSGSLWSGVTARWVGKFACVKDSAGVWSGPYEITAVGSTYDTANSITLGSAHTGAAGVAQEVLILGASKFEIPTAGFPYDWTPAQDNNPTTTGSLSAMAYQYCITLGTPDGFESAPSDWSDPVTPASGAVMLYQIRPLYGYDPGGQQAAHLAGTMVDRVHIYRRGGAHGDYAQRLDTLYVHDRACSTASVVDKLAQAITAGDNHCHLDSASRFPDEGYIRIGTEDIHYTSKAGTQLNFSGTAAANHSINDTVVLHSYVDTLADSALVGVPLRYDRQGARDNQDCIVAAGFVNERLSITVANSTALEQVNNDSRAQLSSMESWRYFRDEDLAGYEADTDTTDETLAVTKPVGAQADPVIGYLPFSPGVLVAMKRHGLYLMSGRYSYGIRVEKQPNMPGGDNPDTMLVHDGMLFWTLKRRVFLSDLDTIFLELSLALPESIDADPTWAVAHDNRVFLFYGTGKYACWDFRWHKELAATGRLAPTPEIGDQVYVDYPCMGNRLNSNGIIYAVNSQYLAHIYSVSGQSVYRIMGTGTNPYNYALADDEAPPAMELEFPEHAARGGTQEVIPQEVWAFLAADGALSAGTMTITPTVRGENQTAITAALDAPTGEALQRIYDKFTSVRGDHAGIKISVPLADMGSGTVCRGIERVVFGVSNETRPAK